ADLAEAHPAPLQEDVDDRAAPALADELDGLVHARAALDRALAEGALERSDQDLAAGGAFERHGVGLRGSSEPRLLEGTVDRDLAGDVDGGREGLEGQDGDGLEQLLV